MQQIASTAVLCTHCHCTDQDFGSPEGKRIVHWQTQLPYGTGMHTTLSNKTRKQSTTPPKPSTINPCLLALFVWQVFTSIGLPLHWFSALYPNYAVNFSQVYLVLNYHQKKTHLEKNKKQTNPTPFVI